MKIDKTCKECGKIFNNYKHSHAILCSKECVSLWKGRKNCKEKNPNWKGGIIKSNGYTMVSVGKGRYKREHRAIMEKYLGRELWPWEIIHHKNGQKHDNRIENLQIVTHNTHTGQVICPMCQYTIEVH